jgi:hypothetical protein
MLKNRRGLKNTMEGHADGFGMEIDDAELYGDLATDGTEVSGRKATLIRPSPSCIGRSPLRTLN